MTIVNKNGTFNVNAAQYNYLVATFDFNEIDADKVQKTNFVNSSWEYEKADIIFNIKKS